MRIMPLAKMQKYVSLAMTQTFAKVLLRPSLRLPLEAYLHIPHRLEHATRKDAPDQGICPLPESRDSSREIVTASDSRTASSSSARHSRQVSRSPQNGEFYCNTESTVVAGERWSMSLGPVVVLSQYPGEFLSYD